MRPNILYPLFSPINTINGVGLRYEKLLNNLCGNRVIDLLFHLPSGLIDRRCNTPLKYAENGKIWTGKIKVIEHCVPKSSKQPYRIVVEDETQQMILTFFKTYGDSLKKQFPVAKQILTAMGIKYLEKEGYEADDIVGTMARMVDEDKDFVATIVSSDKDLLQLISDCVSVKLLKSKDYMMMTPDSFYEVYGIKPIRMIDLKSLMGDSSDNIPGVKGIGEKTALKLLKEYDTLEGVYENIDSIKGSVHDKLVNDKNMAFMSKEMVTIDRKSVV